MRKKIILVSWAIMFLTVLPCRAEDPTQWISGYSGLENDPNTMALWHLDNAATGMLDNSGHGRNWDAILWGQTWNSAAGKFGGGFGSTYPPTPYFLYKYGVGFNALGISTSDGQTVELWFKVPASVEPAAGLFMAQGTEGYLIRIDPTGEYIEGLFYVADVGNVNLFSTTAINDDKWHHIAITRTKSTGEMKLYLDGVVEDSYANGAGKNLYALNGPAYTAESRLGWPDQYGGSPFTGSIDEVRLSSVARVFTPDPNADANTMALWHLDNAATGNLDSSGHGRHFDDNYNYGSINWPAGKFGGAFGSDYPQTPPSFLKKTGAGFNALGISTSDATVELWLKVGVEPQPRAFIFMAQGTEGYLIRLDNPDAGGTGTHIEGVFDVADVGYVGLFSTSDVNDDQWHHVAITRVKATGKMKLYLDGVVEASATLGAGKNLYGLNPASSIGAVLGWGDNYGGDPFTGSIDEVRLSNVAREISPCSSKLYADISGPEGIPDCVVDTYDLDAAEWLQDNAGKMGIGGY